MGSSYREVFMTHTPSKSAAVAGTVIGGPWTAGGRI